MKTFDYIITDEIGIHARPAGALVKEAKKFNAQITLQAKEKSADARKLMAVMGLGARQGTKLTVTIAGEDEEQAAEAMEFFFRENL